MVLLFYPLHYVALLCQLVSKLVLVKAGHGVVPLWRTTVLGHFASRSTTFCTRHPGRGWGSGALPWRNPLPGFGYGATHFRQCTTRGYHEAYRFRENLQNQSFWPLLSYFEFIYLKGLKTRFIILVKFWTRSEITLAGCKTWLSHHWSLDSNHFLRNSRL